MVATPINQASSIALQSSELLNQMQGILSFVQAANVAGEPLTQAQITNLKTRFFSLRDQVVALLNSLSPV